MNSKAAPKKNKSFGTRSYGQTPDLPVFAALISGYLILLYFSNVHVPFMMDDLWYATNISDGGPLRGLSDIIESQVWHYHFWGGRVFTHGFLQLVLMSGERSADVINTLCTLLVAFEMYHLAGLICGDRKQNKPALFALMAGALVTFCPNYKMSMLWQAGCANYVYSTVWILFFYICYFRALNEKKDFPLACVFMVPLGLITGWSTENMGPAAFITVLIASVYIIRKKSPSLSRRIWMIEGVIMSFAGSVMCITAPGNFIRKDVGEAQVSENAYERLLQMLRGVGEYIFPALVLFAGCYMLYRFKKNKCPDMQVLLILFACLLSYGAMILSPHYPDRAAFGTCVLLETASGALLFDSLDQKERIIKTVSVLTLISSMITMIAIIAE